MTASLPASPSPDPVEPCSLARLLRTNEPVTLLLDYDGTLVPFALRPELGVPDQGLVDLLDQLAGREGWRVHIISGRLRMELERFFGAIDFGLHAEHGAWIRMQLRDSWERTTPCVESWPADIIAALRQASAMLPRSFLELKSASIAFHFREVRRDYVANTLPSLRRLLQALSREYGYDLLDGAEILEIRALGVSKANSAVRIVSALAPQATVIAIGDDCTDEELFTALPASASTIRVGPGQTCARYRLAGPPEVRTFLSELAGDEITGARPEFPDS